MYSNCPAKASFKLCALLTELVILGEEADLSELMFGSEGNRATIKEIVAKVQGDG